MRLVVFRVDTGHVGLDLLFLRLASSGLREGHQIGWGLEHFQRLLDLLVLRLVLGFMLETDDIGRG